MRATTLCTLAALVASAAATTAVSGAAPPTHVTVKVLAQRRPAELQRLLNSLDKASYAPNSVIDVEVHVDVVK